MHISVSSYSPPGHMHVCKPTYLRHSAHETGTRPGLRLCFCSPPELAPATGWSLSAVLTGAMLLCVLVTVRLQNGQRV